jgi:chaperonin GroES
MHSSSLVITGPKVYVGLLVTLLCSNALGFLGSPNARRSSTACTSSSFAIRCRSRPKNEPNAKLWNGVVLPSSSSSTAATTEESHRLEGRTITGPLEPLNNFVLVKVAKSEDQTSGGILLTAKAKAKKTEGTVVAVGPGRAHPESGYLLTIPVQPGEGVVYGKYDGTEVDYDGEKHSLIREEDILVKYTSNQLTLDNVEVLNDNVLVFVEPKEEETSSGLLIASSSSSKKKPSTGMVAKVGPGRRTMTGTLTPMEVIVGDMVKFRDFAGNEVKIDEKEYTVVRMADILAKF